MDLVQYRLELIDERNSGLRGLAARCLERVPLAFCAIGLICGIAVEHRIGAGVRYWLALLVPAVLATAVLCLPISRLRKPVFAALAAAILFACLGGIRVAAYRHMDPRDISRLAGEGRTIADLRGRIAGNISIEDRSNWAFGRFQYENLFSTFDMEVMQARCLSGWEEVTGRVRVRVAEPVYDLAPGDYIQVYATLRRFARPMNPGGFDARGFYERHGIHLSAQVETRLAIEHWEKAGNEGPAAAEFQQWLRDSAAAMLKRGRVDEDESDGLLEALLLGRRSHISPVTYEAFRRTGLLHFISLSGMHIGIVIGAIWQAARVAGITRRRRAALCIGAIILFLLIVPAYSPILRAGMIGLVFCSAAILRRHSEPVNTLSLAAIIILLLSPIELFSVGWQLSFGCVLGILLFSRRLEMLFYAAISRLLRRNVPGDQTGGNLPGKMARAAVSLAAMGVAAWLGGAGLMLYHFHNITPLASLWTYLSSPLMTAVLIFGYIKLLLSAVLPTAGELLAPVVSWLAWGFIKIVELMASVRLSEIVVGRVNIWLVALYYCTILYIPFVHWPRPIYRKAISSAMAAAMVVSMGLLLWQRYNPADVEFVCLSMGHGQAAVAKTPDGTFLFDCGSRSLKDCGRRAVLPFLRWQGASRLDAVYLSHGDMDHCNGLPEVVASGRPAAVFVSDALEAELGDYGIDAVLKDSTAGLRRSISAGDVTTLEQVKIHTLWPPDTNETSPLSDNNKSLVTMLEFAGRRILISSDIERHAQQQILLRYPGLKADVVVAPHHGSVRTRYSGFIEALQPEAVIYSCDETQQARALQADT
ncbi:MAG TPA: DNA internalization-related competence protein ComEC/Rec2, partial [Sedimentisphaerales bacterium]|nr:DNA internalization-related competence protein ComEC/Rec2 [Sedimentisphaerales bacterium]